jgi:hypothetical protein
MIATARSGERGQATVEHVGLVVAAAIALSAIAIWVAHELRPPAHPPPVVQAAGWPLESAESWVGRNVDPLAGFGGWRLPRGRRDEPIGGFLKRAAAETAFAASIVGAFGAGAEGRLLERLRRAVADPLGTARAIAETYGAAADPGEVIRAQVDTARRYWERLRVKPWRRAVLTVAHDLGGMGTDLVLARARRAAQNAAARRLRRRFGGPGPGDRGPLRDVRPTLG